MMMKFKPASPIVQRMMSCVMAMMMDHQDRKIRAGQILKEINKVGTFAFDVEP